MKLEEYLTKEKVVYFISPHLDDAILSAGGLIFYLVHKKVEVILITVFTKPSSLPETSHAKRYIRQCGFSDSFKFFQVRVKEDDEICNCLGIKKIHLDFIDAAWRKKTEANLNWFTNLFPEIVHLYPLRLCKYLGIVNKQDKKMMKRIQRKIKSVITSSDPIIFCPVGRGNHVDHIITKQVCLDIFKRVFFWDDYPYCLKKNNIQINFPFVQWNKYLKEKRKLIKKYKTQQHILFGQSLPIINPEKYYINSPINLIVQDN